MLGNGVGNAGVSEENGACGRKLDILAGGGKTFGGGEVGGTILVNGQSMRPSDYARISCYVQQRDVLLASATVRESLALSALLKLPYSIPRRDKMAKVDGILRELGLEECQHTLVGDEGQQIRGISGGEKRRVSVGMELVKDPALLFLDEPTSGLDSEMAVSVMELLVAMARKNRTVVVTIHQPNSLITSLFDDFMLLGTGKPMYYGPWEDAMAFFAGAGYPCPVYTNPTDHFMHILREPGVVQSLASAYQAREVLAASPVPAADVELGTEGKLEPHSTKHSLDMETGGDEVSHTEQSSRSVWQEPSPFFYQVYILVPRMFRMWWRSPAMLMAEFAQYAFMAVLIGLMYLQLSHSLATGVSDRVASLWFAMAVLSFTPSYTAVTQWDKERVLLRKESGSGMYSLQAWFCSKTLTVAPIQIAQTSAFCLVCYFMVGYVVAAKEFFIFLVVYVLFQLTSESVGVLCAALTKDATLAVLLDILAGGGRTFGGGTVGGTILVNGQRMRPSDYARISCYVQQRDVLLASATVRESLAVSALLKLPYSIPKRDKMAKVDGILRELGLEECQHTLVGDEAQQIRGISGGQKRRVSVGMELVKDPALLFLDEPTSGLDSEMAVSVMELLVALARKNRTVVVTIHQPNSLITSLFDDFMLLGAGKLLYYGPWENAVEFFSNAGYPCPVYTNPTDHFMHILRGPAVVESLAAAYSAREAQPAGSPRAPDLELGTRSAAESKPAPQNTKCSSLDMEAGGEGAPAGPEQLSSSTKQEHAPFPYQAYILMLRMFRMWWRSPAMLMAEFAQYAFMAVFVGLMYLQLSHSVDTGVNDRVASLWFAMAVLSFTPSFTAVTQWDKERVLLRREAGSGMYSLRAWFCAKTLTVTPIQVAQTAAFCVVCYFMVGYVVAAKEFFVYLAVYVMFQLTSETVGVLCAVLTKDATLAVLALTFVLLFLLSFSGFIISSIPVYFRWIGKISYLTYAFAAVVRSQFDSTMFYNAEGQPVPGSSVIPPTIDNGIAVGPNLAILLGIMVGTRFLAFLSIELVARTKRL
ncbi:hypothetical protein N2152v2_008761 [Parachlorella kessleri]